MDEYFWNRVESHPASACLIWTGPMMDNTFRGNYRSHGIYKYLYGEKYISITAQRYAWHQLRQKQKLDALGCDEELQNTCGNFRCVEPTHHTKTKEKVNHPPYRPRQPKPPTAVELRRQEFAKTREAFWGPERAAIIKEAQG